LKIAITIRLIGRLPLQFSIPLFVALIYVSDQLGPIVRPSDAYAMRMDADAPPP